MICAASRFLGIITASAYSSLLHLCFLLLLTCELVELKLTWQGIFDEIPSPLTVASQWSVSVLNPDFEFVFQEWHGLGVEQLRLSTIDITGVPTLENLKKGVHFLVKHRKNGNSVYVHCKAGRSRSATMVAAYLIQVCRIAPDLDNQLLEFRQSGYF
uniref:Tyrosine specific protein phosphatases domain-containing protein n=1 Tax=Callorhinchus milii TaxID=7868 RepID=A0A4W3GH60_CALMI